MDSPETTYRRSRRQFVRFQFVVLLQDVVDGVGPADLKMDTVIGKYEKID
jgi:hypothetical protein